MAFDFITHPELRNSQLALYYFESPHKQIFESFWCDVVKVHDGDTITVRWHERDFDFPIRFLEINAPELNAGGKEAGDFLRSRIDKSEVFVQIDPRNRVDKYGRLLGRIFHAGVDMNQLMLDSGHAHLLSEKSVGAIPVPDKSFEVKAWQTS